MNEKYCVKKISVKNQYFNHFTVCKQTIDIKLNYKSYIAIIEPIEVNRPILVGNQISSNSFKNDIYINLTPYRPYSNVCQK